MRRPYVLAAGLLLSVMTPARADDAAPGPVTVPIAMLENGRFFSGHFTVQVRVNGKGPYRLIFDTGAPVVLLSNRIAKECDLLKAAPRRAAGVPLMMPGQVRVDSLQIGDLKTDDVAAFVVDHPTVKAIADVFGPIDGIVGFPVFARYRTAVDYQARRLTFSPNGYKPADVLQTLMTTVLAEGRDRKGRPTVLAPAAQWGLQVRKAADDEDPGVTVADVLAESAAARAGVRAGDRLLTIDGRWTDSVADCFRAAAGVKPGQTVELSLRRGGRDITLSVTPADGM
jgi:PDZ domain/Aspartyl protease